jgi:hypothetical protein
MAGTSGSYSNVIIYDENRRYYYLWPQKNRPVLDDEIRSMGVGLLDQVRRSMQSVYGDVAAPHSEYSKPGIAASYEAFKVKEAIDKTNNFIVKGGTSLDNPAVIYAKGFYIFITGDIEYKNQMVPSESYDLETAVDKSKTQTLIPDLTTPSSDRMDIVYLDLHFEETTAKTGSDNDIYLDTGLKNSIVGTETANRLRAVFDIKVYEGWPTDGSDDFNYDSFETHPFFLGGLVDPSNPVDNHYKVPIAILYRKANDALIDNADIVDLLSLYDKRAFTLQELKHRLSHGGYSQRDVYQKGLTGNDPRFSGAVIDESARATGLNQGIDTEAFNTNSVTPRVVSIEGKYELGSLLIGSETGSITYPLPEEDPAEALNYGELAANEASIKSVNIGYDRGVTGLREYRDSLRIHAKGITGSHGIYVENVLGETGSYILRAVGLGVTGVEDYTVIDYRGSVGINTMQPGWDGPNSKWNTDRYSEAVNIALDVNASVRAKKDLYVDGNTYLDGDLISETLRIPGIISEGDQATLGFTGIPQQAGLTGSQAALAVKRGVAVQGVDGRFSPQGETGVAGVYESFDIDGNRVFTIGDMGEAYDRVVKTLYGEDLRRSWETDNSFLFLPDGLGEVIAGDTIEYSIVWEDGSRLDDTYIFLQSGYPAIEDLRSRIISQAGLERGPFTYTDYFVDEFGVTQETVKNDGYAYGVQIVNNPFSGSLGIDLHGRIIIKEMGEINKSIFSVEPMTLTRGAVSVEITMTESSVFGSIDYGGATQDLKFAKLDIGEAADAWLINGDVFFNGTGKLGRVSFSPNVIFRNNTYFYGLAYADRLIFNYATVNNIRVKNKFVSEQVSEFQNVVAVGPNSLETIIRDVEAGDSNLRVFVNGDTKSRYFTVEGGSSDRVTTGQLWFTNYINKKNIGTYIGGTPGSDTSPFGIHMVDSIGGVEFGKRFFVVDFSDGSGNYGNVDFTIRGDLEATRHIKSLTLTSGDAEINPDLALNVGGTARVNGILEVEGIEFIGDNNNDATGGLFTPVNVELINDNRVDNNHINTVINRVKKFTITKKVNLNNQNKLDIPGLDTETLEGAAQYYNTMIAPTNYRGLWGHDTMSYSEDDIRTITGSDGRTNTREVNVIGQTNAAFQRFKFNRINTATLGTLFIEWNGNTLNSFSGGNEFDTLSVIRDYYLESPYFPSGSIKWDADDHGNFLVNIQGSLVDNKMEDTSIFTIDKSLCLFINPNAWVQTGVVNASDASHDSYVLYYPIENITEGFNVVDFEKQTSYVSEASFPDESGGWRAAVYPRFKSVSTNFVPSSDLQVYTGQWDIDIVVFPTILGRVHNLLGELKLSFIP